MLPLINPVDLIKAADFKWLNRHTVKFVMHFFRYPEINHLYARHKNAKGFDFINRILTDLKVRYHVSDAELENIPTKGSFIIIANHPYGGIEGLILLNILSKRRPDVKIMANFLFQHLEPIKDLFFPVNPFETIKDIKSISGLKEALYHLAEGHPLIIFPAGEVSTWHDHGKITDRKWHNGAIKFIRKADVPVIPVHFSGTNSYLFHLLGLIHPMLRTARIPTELLNKKHKTIYVRIGKGITTSEIRKFDDNSQLGRYLRARTYALEHQQEVKKFYIPVFQVGKIPEDIISPISSDVLEKEIKQLHAHDLLFQFKHIGAYLASSHQIPQLIQEIGRLREVTFRAVGEGTLRSVDLDEYDYYYHHLFLWDHEQHQLVGAYRMGYGWEILEQYGMKGFYTRSLFKYKKEFQTVLSQSIELGRSFIVQEYQKNPLSLFLLWKGIFYTVIRHASCRYLLGPVSISQDYSHASRAILVNYVRQHHFDTQMAKYVIPRKKYKPVVSFDTNILVSSMSGLTDVDKLIEGIENQGRMPVLLKKYLQLNGKIIAFNVDPKFNSCLDGLMLLDLNDVPVDMLRQFMKEDSKRELKKYQNFNKVINPILMKRACIAVFTNKYENNFSNLLDFRA
ncbi:MAG TPA: lysophospholipid acyltransferase family protein [Bacteroidales bacterium]|nr:lysophospholipid acyltransferase family protein [Bacteroidales bacterium]HPO65529.1 lysophospholipid acyltransferase family protein [Bacteroidales bacterium]